MIKHQPLQRIQFNWKKRLVIKAIIWFSMFLIFALSLSSVIGFSGLVVGTGGLIAIIFIIREMKKLPNDSDIVRLVNDQFQSSEYSTELIFEDSAIGLNALQRERLLVALNQSLPKFDYPIHWRDIMWTLGGMILVLASAFFLASGKKQSAYNDQPVLNENVLIDQRAKNDSTYLKNRSVVITPPKYTELEIRTTPDLNVVFPEQSMLSWSLQFEGAPQAVWMHLNGGDSLPMNSREDLWQLTRKPSNNELYTLNFLDAKSNIITSPYYELQMIPDEPPIIEISGIAQFQRLEYKKGLTLKMDINLSDDYGLTDGYLIATITKGSGESVKFREQKIPFSSRITGKKVNTELTLKLDEFGMEPGNELYFYGSAFDNHKPTIQQSRTETFFYILEDTTDVKFSLQGGLGIDLMPDYFRSQLQIILDTKKLIQEKDQLDENEFRSESNALGFDQKQLRLKYGQFIGDEEDSGLEFEEENPAEGMDTSQENVVTEFGHDTDHENEEGQLMDKGTEPGPLDEFLHQEDNEAVGFYTQSLKAKLRAALDEMWDAELYLRLYDPDNSLPYQYKAQELLQEIRNHARIYVQRIGFDPPPVNVAESRLTGELKELNDQPFIQNLQKETMYPAIRNAISEIDELAYSRVWDTEIKQALKAAGDELAGLAVDYPGKYLETLNQLRQILVTDSLTNEDWRLLKEIKTVIEKALPTEFAAPAPMYRNQGELTREFIENLLRSKNQ